MIFKSQKIISKNYRILKKNAVGVIKNEELEKALECSKILSI